jgi:hypothetical protein
MSNSTNYDCLWVSHADNFPADRTAALLIERDRLRAVTYSGAKQPLRDQ